MEFDEFTYKFVRGNVVLAYDINSNEKIRYMWRNGGVMFTTCISHHPMNSAFTVEELYDCVNRDGSHWVMIDKFSKRCI